VQPVGIKFGHKPGIIVNQSQQGLEVESGKTLGLLGGEIQLKKGEIKAGKANIIIGAVGDNNQITLTPESTGGYSVSYHGVRDYADVSLSEGAKVYVSGNGSIKIQGENITLTQRSQIYSFNFGEQLPGNISIRGKEITLRGIETGIYSQISGNGLGANIAIETGKLIAIDGGAIEANVKGSGRGGNLKIKASNSVVLSGVGFAQDNKAYLSNISALVLKPGSGNAGDITLETPIVEILSGSQISASTFGTGNAGNMNIQASKGIKAQGVAAKEGLVYRSGLFAQVKPGATGNAGDITINTSRLILTEAGGITASTFGMGNAANISISATEEFQATGLVSDSNNKIYISGIFAQVQSGVQGNGGDITINTGKLTVSQGAQISSATFGTGDAGDVRVNATQEVRLDGVVFSQNELGDIVAQTSGIFARVQFGASGQGGDITIITPKLTISNVGRISASTFGIGNAGNILVNASQQVLVRGAKVSPDGIFQASSIFARVGGVALGKGGNIYINTGKLTVADGAQISAESVAPQGIAGNVNINASQLSLNNHASILTNTQAGNGGNINIDSKFILASPFENSNITANSLQGSGGKVTIDSKGLFGIQANSVDTGLTSDITASSANGPQGTVTINNPNVQPKTGLINLTSEPIVYQFVFLCKDKNHNKHMELYHIGRGGKLVTPDDFQSVDGINLPWLELVRENQSQNTSGQEEAGLEFDSMALFLSCQ